MAQVSVTPLGAVARGIAAGLAGTVAMTAYQELWSRVKATRSGGSGDSQEGENGGEQPSWDEAPAPAQVGKRILEGVFREDVPPEKISLLTNVMHWSYGTAWGSVYGLLQGTIRANPVVTGLAFGSGVWAMSYLQLVPMGLYEPPWKYPAKTVARDLSYHLVYGIGVAAGYEALDRTRTIAPALKGER